MKQLISYAAAAVILTALIGFFAATIFWRAEPNTGGPGGVGQAAPVTSVAPDSPLPAAELGIPLAPTELPWIAGEPFTGVESIKSTEMTPLPLTPEPEMPPTPFLADEIVKDETNTFSIAVPKGWYAFFPRSILEGEVTVANFDIGALEGRTKGGISLHFGIGELSNGRTFEQWLAERTAQEMAPLYGPPPRVITDSQPITVAGFTGVSSVKSIVMESGDWWPIQHIYLPINKNKVMGIVIKPVLSSDYEKALSLLQSMRVELD